MNRAETGRSGKVWVALLAAMLGGVAGGVTVRSLDGAARPLSSASSQGGGARPYVEIVEPGKPLSLGEQVVQVVEKVGPAVVAIETELRAPDAPFFGGGRGAPPQGQGSGFIINGADRLVVTNNHVVERARRIRVTLPDKRSFGARVLGSDAIGDIALLKLDGDGQLPQIAFGDSDRLEIGQITVAIGNPLGLENTVTQGVLSAIGRRLEEGHVQGIPLEDLLQMDAAINPGNSGGPLLDGYGRVIGMNTAIASQAQGIGFAVAANSIKRAVEDILQHGRVVRPWLGVSMVDPAQLAPEELRQLGIAPSQSGAVIQAVRPGDPAARAGLRPGDVVTDAGGKKVTAPEDLRGAIRGLRPGAEVVMKGLRDGRAQTWRVTIAEMPPPDQLGR